MKNHQRRHRCLWPPRAYVPVCTHVVATHIKYTKQNKVFRASLLCRNPKVHPKLHYKESDIPGEDEVTTSGDALSNLNPKWGKKRQAGTWEHNSIPLKILSSQKSWDSLKSSRPKKEAYPWHVNDLRPSVFCGAPCTATQCPVFTCTHPHRLSSSSVI